MGRRRSLWCPMSAEIEVGSHVPAKFVDALRGLVDADASGDLEGVHRFVYLDTESGKRTTGFVRVGNGRSQVRSYVFFPYTQAKDLRTEATSDDPWGVLLGRVVLDPPVPGVEHGVTGEASTATARGTDAERGSRAGTSPSGHPSIDAPQRRT